MGKNVYLSIRMLPLETIQSDADIGEGGILKLIRRKKEKMAFCEAPLEPGRRESCALGFTLIEYIVVLSLSIMLTAIAVPNLVALDASFRRMQGRSQIEGDIFYVRSLAMKEGGRAAIVPSTGGTSYTINVGHAPYGAFPGTDRQIQSRSLPSGVAIVKPEPLVFDAKGHLVGENGTMKSASVVLSWKTKSYVTISLSPMGFML